MVVALQIVCVSAVFCGALHAAPTVTYDQRQQGEFNVQVDVDDVAIILLGSEEFAQRAILQGNKVQQIFGRHNGVKSKKKHHKKPVNCSTMATANPEVPYSSESPPTYLPTSSQGYEELYSTSSQDTVQGGVPVAAVAPVFENVPTDLDGQKAIESHASYSEATITPSAAQNAFEKNVDSADDVAVNSSEMVAMKTVEKPAVGATVETNNITEKAAIETIDKSADATTLQASSEISNGGSKADIKTDEILSTNFEENPVSISSDVKIIEKITNDETVKINETPEKNTEDKSYEITTVKIVETVEIGEVKPAEMVVIKTIEKPTDSAISEGIVEEPAVDASRVNVLDSQVDTKTTNEPTEMIAMKPVEKPTFSEVLKVVKKPADAADTVKAADIQTSITTSVDLSKSPTEMVAMKTMENPQTAVGPTDTIEKSGITTSTKLVEVQEDTKKQNSPSVENIVSRSAPKQTEMVAVKTMENSATVKSVISVKTVIKPGIQKSTHSSNSSLIMRKVGDRKPLPTITLEVATPKVL
ncbi:unnamed protein product [Macrosiphum euphorbiae]|uniref:Uncharacterized protein n=1 Tax=Macrosiphum euphorbiae TaxID=13131 RepID=A0AAV0W7N8_9HEMI|nr:unnamed protein product [Macrosiphum euphorbiae]